MVISEAAKLPREGRTTPTFTSLQGQLGSMAGHLKRSFEATSESLEPPRKRQGVLSRGQIAKRARETELKNFLLDLPEYAPTVPAESTRFFLRNGGLSTANDQM